MISKQEDISIWLKSERDSLDIETRRFTEFYQAVIPDPPSIQSLPDLCEAIMLKTGMGRIEKVKGSDGSNYRKMKPCDRVMDWCFKALERESGEKALTAVLLRPEQDHWTEIKWRLSDEAIRVLITLMDENREN